MGSIFVDISVETTNGRFGSLNPIIFLICMKKQREMNISFHPIHRKHIKIMVQDE